MPSFQFLIRYDAGDKIRENEASDQIYVSQQSFSQPHAAQVEEQENGNYLLQFFALFGDQLPVDTEMKDRIIISCQCNVVSALKYNKV